MSITRADVADLHNQDVVRLSNPIVGVVVEGKLFEVQGVLQLCSWMPVRRTDGEPALNWLGWTLTVVSRAPLPLYVNHPRTEPVPGDVVRTSSGFVYSCTTTPSWVGTRERGCETPWRSTRHGGYDSGPIYDKGLRLLVDGETGQVVP